MATEHKKYLWGGEWHRCGGVGCRGVVLETSKSQDIFPPITVRKWEQRWRKHRENFLYLPITPQEKRVGP